jgi:hypothetical protein
MADIAAAKAGHHQARRQRGQLRRRAGGRPRDPPRVRGAGRPADGGGFFPAGGAQRLPPGQPLRLRPLHRPDAGPGRGVSAPERRRGHHRPGDPAAKGLEHPRRGRGGGASRRPAGPAGSSCSAPPTPPLCWTAPTTPTAWPLRQRACGPASPAKKSSLSWAPWPTRTCPTCWSCSFPWRRAFTPSVRTIPGRWTPSALLALLAPSGIPARACGSVPEAVGAGAGRRRDRGRGVRPGVAVPLCRRPAGRRRAGRPPRPLLLNGRRPAPRRGG